ncbi:MAG: hypothetical protein OCC49_02705 [Fibrobacterales bacterium]
MELSISKTELWEQICNEYDIAHSPLKAILEEKMITIKNILRNNGIKCIGKYRVKNRESYFSKLQKIYDNKETVLLSDLLGIRIVVHFMEDVSHVVSLISKQFEVIETEVKSDQLSFREFSYDSTHLLITLPDTSLPFITGNQRVIEIQVRTTLQDAWAEVEHELIYKSNIHYPNKMIKRKMASLNASLTLSDIIFQEIRDYQNNLMENKESRTQLMHEKASLLSKEDFNIQTKKDDNLPRPNKKNNKNKESIIHEALRCHSAGDYEQSIALYTKALEQDLDESTMSIIYNHRGMASFMEAEYTLAFNDFSFSLAHNPENHRTYTNRGIIHKLFKRYNEAIQDFLASLELNHNQPEVLLHLAKTYLDDDQLTNALSTVNRAQSLDPELDEVHLLHQRISKKLIT